MDLKNIHTGNISADRKEVGHMHSGIRQRCDERKVGNRTVEHPSGSVKHRGNRLYAPGNRASFVTFQLISICSVSQALVACAFCHCRKLWTFVPDPGFDIVRVGPT